MKRILFSTFTALFAFSFLFAMCLAFASEASAGLVYEQRIVFTKLDQAKIDPNGKAGKGSKDDLGIHKNESKYNFSQRILLSGNKMKIRNSGGWTFFVDLDTGTLTRLDRNRGVYSTLTFAKFLEYRAETEKKNQVKKAAHARFLLADIMNSIKAMKDPAEREKNLKNPPKMVRELKLIIEGKYSYKMYEQGKKHRYAKKAFKVGRLTEIKQNHKEFIKMLSTKEIPFSANRFLGKLAIFPLPAAKLLEGRKDFTNAFEFPYDFTKETVKTYIEVTGFCPADLPDELFKIPSGYKEQSERFETIFETPKF